jgi:DNA-directed RNA polymerase specialized sigma24 family protein
MKLGDPTRAPGERVLSTREVWELLGQWREQELALARGYRQCARLSKEQLEDLYHDVALRLHQQRFTSEAYLRHIAWLQLCRLGRDAYRDESTHHRIWRAHAPGIHRLLQARVLEDTPENRVLADEDHQMAREFMRELSIKEREAFCCALTHDAGYENVALHLNKPIPEVRRLLLGVERKRERFAIIYQAGRLCGYRSQTIKLLKEGRSTSRELLERATVHLERCPACRAEHDTNSERLHATFERQVAAAILPLPAIGLLARTSWLLHELLGGVGRAPRHLVSHGRLAALYGGEGTTTKLARLATVAALAGGGTIATHTITSALSNPRPHHHAAHLRPGPSSTTNAVALIPIPAPQTRMRAPKTVDRPAGHRPKVPGRIVPTRVSGHVVSDRAYNEFDNPAIARAPAKTAAVSRPEEHVYREFSDPSSTVAPVRRQAPPPEEQKGGGPFSP